jgi:hypothetical protein
LRRRRHRGGIRRQEDLRRQGSAHPGGGGDDHGPKEPSGEEAFKERRFLGLLRFHDQQRLRRFILFILIIRFSDFERAKRTIEGPRDPKRFTEDGLAGAHTRSRVAFEGFHQVILEFSGEVGGRPG